MLEDIFPEDFVNPGYLLIGRNTPLFPSFEKPGYHRVDVTVRFDLEEGNSKLLVSRIDEIIGFVIHDSTPPFVLFCCSKPFDTTLIHLPSYDYH